MSKFIICKSYLKKAKKKKRNLWVRESSFLPAIPYNLALWNHLNIYYYNFITDLTFPFRRKPLNILYLWSAFMLFQLNKIHHKTEKWFDLLLCHLQSPTFWRGRPHLESTSIQRNAIQQAFIEGLPSFEFTDQTACLPITGLPPGHVTLDKSLNLIWFQFPIHKVEIRVVPTSWVCLED